MPQTRLRDRLRRAVDRLGEEQSHSVALLRELVQETLATALFPTGELVRHEKRGSRYRVYDTGHLNSADNRQVSEKLSLKDNMYRFNFYNVAFDREEIEIYCDVDTGAISVRPRAEFRDGRFTTLLPALPDGTNDRLERSSDMLATMLGTGTSSLWSTPSASYAKYVGPDPSRRGKLYVISFSEGAQGQVDSMEIDPTNGDEMGPHFNSENVLNYRLTTPDFVSDGSNAITG